MRKELIKSTGNDVDPSLVEAQVTKEVAEIKAKRLEDAAIAERQVEAEPTCISSGRRRIHSWVRRLRRGKGKGDVEAPPAGPE